MKKTYIIPSSVQLNMETEQMIAASGLQINPGEADQWSNERTGWSSEDWSGAEEE